MSKCIGFIRYAVRNGSKLGGGEEQGGMRNGEKFVNSKDGVVNSKDGVGYGNMYVGANMYGKNVNNISNLNK